MKKYLFTPIILLFVALTINSCANDVDDNLHAGDPSKVIAKDSDLYDQLVRVTTDTENPLEDIVCIDFVYPPEVKLYDANLIETSSVILTHESDFQSFNIFKGNDSQLCVTFLYLTT